jgi:hypothetical protein
VSEWLLAFDAGCGACTDVMARIETVVRGRLTVAGLGDERVRELRRRAYGERPPFAPTLLRVEGDRVRAWTGTALSVRLARLLGLSRSLAVVRALNRADVVVHGSRRSLLKAVPGVAVGAFLLTGGLAAPAMAAPGRRMTNAEAREWVANLAQRPTSYQDVTALPMVRRRAVYGLSSVDTKVALWQEHLRRYRQGHPDLTGAQTALLDSVSAAVPALLGAGRDASRVEAARARAVEVLGHDRAVAAFGVLGAAGTELEIDCDCHMGFSGCSSCGEWECLRVPDECGFLWTQDCDGLCGA